MERQLRALKQNSVIYFAVTTILKHNVHFKIVIKYFSSLHSVVQDIDVTIEEVLSRTEYFQLWSRSLHQSQSFGVLW